MNRQPFVTSETPKSASDSARQVVMSAAGQAALEKTLEIAPDIVLTDIEMPRMTGLELALDLKKRDVPAKVVIVTTFARAGFCAAL